MFFLKGNSLLIFSLFVGLSYGQNLVPNGSFEDLSDCPQNNLIPDICDFWFSPTNATPDIFNRCHIYSSDSLTICPLDTGNTSLDPWGNAVPINALGCQEPHSGDGYAGLHFYYNVVQWREYLQVPIAGTLLAGENYLVSIHVSLSDQSIYGTENIHLGFVSDSLHYDEQYVVDFGVDLMSPIGAPIMEKDEWIELSWEYTADGTEEYLVIGNFYLDENTIIETNNCSYCYGWAYYYIDDVYVGKIDDNSIAYQEIIYPTILQNPVLENINFLYSGNDSWKFNVYNTIGQRLIYNKDLTQNDVSFLSKGYYFLELHHNSVSKIISFIKK